QTGNTRRFAGATSVTGSSWCPEPVGAARRPGAQVRRGRRACRFREVTVPTRGVVYVHSTPLAVCPHVEWAVARALTVPVRLRWSTQPIDPGARRAEFNWTGRPGTGARIATELRQWPMVRFEVTEEPSPGVDGERFMH